MDPRVSRLVEKYAYARGDVMLGRRRPGLPSAEELAGWALERSKLDPVGAVSLLRRVPMPKWQKRRALAVFKPLVTTIDLTRPRR